MRNFRLDDESGHQEALFNWAAYRTGLMPELQYMYHVPNGGKRDAKTGETTGKGVFTIVEVKAGQGASAGWGRLKSGAGWISLDYATRLA